MTLMSDPSVLERILHHVDHGTTDQSETTWREPVVHYRSEERFDLELERVLRRVPTPFCPSAALPETGSYIAREAAGTPLLAVRGADRHVRVFRNACRHRGTQVATGSGCSKAFVCPYHGWSYGLDGGLLHVPHEHGFPGLDKSARGLVPLETIERHGIVFVAQEKPTAPGAGLDSVLAAVRSPLIDTSYRPSSSTSSELEVQANWKILVEGFLEGYHIRATHRKTFYPVQFDNLNVVETFGANSRVAYPYRAVNKLRDAGPAERSAEGVLTYVHHLFPNAMLATFPGRRILVLIEPLAVDRTLLVSYGLTNRAEGDVEAQAALRRGGELVDVGAAEDRAMACSVQRGLASGANEYFEFGRFEGAIGHFHRMLHAAIDGTAWDTRSESRARS